jgi:G2/mitotic-specific cyclin-B, other
MRTVLIDWIVSVHHKFRLLPETLFLCVYVIDMYLSRYDAERKELQLIGVTALFIASKYEEVWPPEAKDFIYIMDRSYKHQNMLDMELKILDLIDYRISVPTAFHFYNRFVIVLDVSKSVSMLGLYYLERTLQEYCFVGILPSLVAASSLCLALNQPAIYENDSLPCLMPGVVRAVCIKSISVCSHFCI